MNSKQMWLVWLILTSTVILSAITVKSSEEITCWWKPKQAIIYLSYVYIIIYTLSYINYDPKKKPIEFLTQMHCSKCDKL